MLKNYEELTSELDEEASTSTKEEKEYKAIKRCAHLEERLQIGDKVPKSWPKEAIDFLIRKKAIEEVK